MIYMAPVHSCPVCGHMLNDITITNIIVVLPFFKEASERFGDPEFLDSLVVTDR